MNGLNSLQPKRLAASYVEDLNQGFLFYEDEETYDVSSDRHNLHLPPSSEDFMLDSVFYLTEEKEIKLALEKYKIIDLDEIKEFLRIRPNVVRFLAKAYYSLISWFIHVDSVNITLTNGMESDEPDQIFINVILKDGFDIDEAIERYNTFYDKWWYSNSYELEQSLILGIS